MSFWLKSSASWEISVEKIEIALRKLVGYDNPKKTPVIFSWIDKNLLLRGLRKIVDDKSIGIMRYEEWEIVMNEWEWDCFYFFLLIEWDLVVCKEDIEIAQISESNIVWEIGFAMTAHWIPGKRTAKVQANEVSYLLPIGMDFIWSLPESEKTKLYRNLVFELSQKLFRTTDRMYWDNHVNLSAAGTVTRARESVGQLFL